MPQEPAATETFDVFISHKVEDRQIARYLGEDLRSLSNRHLEVHVCEDIPGGEEWRKWIEERIEKSKILIFLYTDERADWGWCLYEIGFFLGSHPSEMESKCHMICLKDSSISVLPSPIQQFQAYDSEKDTIEKFFNDLLYEGTCTNNIRLNDELHTKMRNQFETAVKRISDIFSTTQTESYARSVSIGLPEPDDTQALPNIEHAFIDGDQSVMEILNAPSTGIKWTQLYEQFRKENQAMWLDELRRFFDEVITKQVRRPGWAMTPFAHEGRSYIPVLSRIDRKKRVTSQGRVFIPKTLSILLIPKPIELSDEPPDPVEMLHGWSTHYPASVVKVGWKKKSDQNTYLPEDIIGVPIVCAINDSFAHLFDYGPGDFPSPDGPSPATSESLLQRIERYVLPDHLRKLKKDQAEVVQRIVFEERNSYARVPLQFNELHPSYPNALFLPCLISKRVVGSQTGEHKTYLVISYVRDFWPVDHPKNPYYQDRC
jgi:hypothetical protein